MATPFEHVLLSLNKEVGIVRHNITLRNTEHLVLLGPFTTSMTLECMASLGQTFNLYSFLACIDRVNSIDHGKKRTTLEPIAMVAWLC